MTDDSKEFAFNSVIRWLREGNFVINEEKSTIVTSDFYAKMLSPAYPNNPIEIKSSPSIGNGILIQIKLGLTPTQIATITNPDGKMSLDLDKRMSTIIKSSSLVLSEDRDALLLESMVSYGSHLLESKHQLVNLISSMLESATSLQEIT